MKIRAYDLEASNLNADFGLILTFGSKIVGEGKPVVLRIDDYFDESRDLIKAERKMLKDIYDTMLDSDVWLGHFSTHYDLPFINSRLLYHGLPVLPPNFPALDTWKIARNRLKLRNNRLATVQEFLKLEDEKNSIKPEQWIRALSGHRKSIDYIVEHNRRDVLVLEQAYVKLRPLILDHPHSGLAKGKNSCAVCGSTKVEFRGWHYTAAQAFRRFRCLACGKWDRERKPTLRVRDLPPLKAA